MHLTLLSMMATISLLSMACQLEVDGFAPWSRSTTCWTFPTVLLRTVLILSSTVPEVADLEAPPTTSLFPLVPMLAMIRAGGFSRSVQTQDADLGAIEKLNKVDALEDLFAGWEGLLTFPWLKDVLRRGHIVLLCGAKVDGRREKSAASISSQRPDLFAGRLLN